MADQPILLSGMQPTGHLHLGNYLGALKNWVELQNSGKYQCYFVIVDLHALTQSSLTPKELNQNLRELAADYLAAGLDPKKAVIFQQSQVSAHSELAWVLGTVTPLGELRRMTQFKDKSEGEKENSNSGLLTYPVLQAADIILYDAKFVPVGEDQVQHVELTRTIARQFNKKFPARPKPGEGGGQTFIGPQVLLTPASRVMSLSDPTKKMSKSQPESCLFLDDEPDTVRKKVKRAVTDSGSEVKYDENNKKAVSNLLDIYTSLSGDSIPELEKKYRGKNYSKFKSDLAEVIVEHFAEYRAKKKALLAKPKTLSSVLNTGSKKAGRVAGKKMKEVRKKIGLVL